MKETKDENKKRETIIDKTKKILKKDSTKKLNKTISKDKDMAQAQKVDLTKNKQAISDKVSKKKYIFSNRQKSEYYDLPYRYNQTVIKILAQTPHALFIYWDISDSDRAEMLKKYGENFFNETKPVLLIHNKTLNTSFEINIDDFTNSWYLHTPTSNCVFNIELGRRKITKNDAIKFKQNSEVLHITKSNTIESPNDHILKDLPKTVYLKNVKTNELEKREISNYKVDNIYNLIELYNDENNVENNPSSEFKIS